MQTTSRSQWAVKMAAGYERDEKPRVVAAFERESPDPSRDADSFVLGCHAGGPDERDPSRAEGGRVSVRRSNASAEDVFRQLADFFSLAADPEVRSVTLYFSLPAAAARTNMYPAVPHDFAAPPDLSAALSMFCRAALLAIRSDIHPGEPFCSWACLHAVRNPA